MLMRPAIHPLKIVAAVGVAFLVWGLVLAYASSPASAADGACTPTDLVIGTANPACVSADKVVADGAALLGAQRTATNLGNQMNLLGTLAKSFQGTPVEQAAQAELERLYGGG